MVRSLIARNVLDQGLGYLKSHGYQVLTSYGDDARQLAPDKVDWNAVAAGRAIGRGAPAARPRQLHGRDEVRLPQQI